MKKLIFYIEQNSNIFFSSSLLVLTIISILILTYFLNYNKKNDYSDINNLMIVTHPTDELIFGGSHLLNDSYLVVCITCTKEDKEFINLINNTNDKYILLEIEEYNNGSISNFNNEYNSIYNSLKEIIKLKKWNIIVTHNPEGEYGHKQHKIISNIVTSITTKNLYYFGKYYSPNTIKDYYTELTPILNKEDKYQLLRFYPKEDILSNFIHQLYYENWLPYEQWGDE